MRFSEHEIRYLRAGDRAYWVRVAKARGVSIEKFCKREGLGWTFEQCADPRNHGRWETTNTDRGTARRWGLHDTSIYQWRKRHPDQAHLSPDEVAAIVYENRQRQRGEDDAK